MTGIKCIGRDGQEREFNCSEPDIDGYGVKRYTYRIRPIASEPIESFEFTVEEVGEDTVKVVVMDRHHEPAYSAMGIPERMIQECATTLGKKVISSNNGANIPGEFRTPRATKVWERLVAQERATFDEQQDRYTFTG